MSTHQPPGGPPPEGNQGYAQPQDPWEGGFEPGLASVPTDPIPQQYEPYPQGHGYQQQGDVWSQETVAHGAPYPHGPQQTSSNRAGMIVLIVLIMLILGGGGGFAAWYFTKQRNVATDPTASPSPTVPTTSAPTTVAVFPYNVDINDCIVNNGTEDDPDVEVVPCATANSFKVIKIVTGAGLVENAEGKFDRDTTSVAACQGTSYEFWYGYQDTLDEAKDVFFCMVDN